MIAEEVIVELQAKIAEYKKNLVEAEHQFTHTTDHIESKSKLLSERVRLHFGALSLYSYAAFAAIPAAVAGAIDKAIEFAGAMKEQAAQVGTTAKNLQEYHYAAGQLGIDNAQMDKGLQFLTRSFGQAQDGAKKPVKALQELGFTTKETASIIRMDAGEALPLLAEKFKAIENPAERARIEIGLFGRAGQQLDPLLTQGAEGINGLRNAAEQIGAVLGDEEIEKLHQAEIRYNALKQVLSVKLAGTVGENAGALLSLGNAAVAMAGGLLQGIEGLRLIKAELSEPITMHDLFGGGGGVLGAMQRGADRVEAGKSAQVPGARYAGHIRIGGPDDTGMPLPRADDMAAIEKALKAKGLHDKKDSGKSAQEKLDEYLNAAASIQQRLNTAMADALGTEEAKVKAQKENIDIQEEVDERQITANKDYTAKQKETLISQSRFAALKAKEVIDAEALDKLHEQDIAVQQGNLNDMRDILTAQEALTDDRGKRAEIEKHLLALSIEEERLAQQAIIDSRTATDAQKEQARHRLEVLPILQGLGNANIDRTNQSPGQAYLHDLRTGLKNVGDTIQSLEIDNLKKLDDYLSSAVSKVLGLNGALGDTVTQLIRIGVQKEVIEPLANLLFGGGGWNSGGIISAVGSLFGAVSNNPFSDHLGPIPRASGGPVNSGSTYLVGEQGPELFQPSQSGMIVPNHVLGGGGGGGGGGSVTIQIVKGEMFDARVVEVAGPVAVQVVQAAAPRVTDYGNSKMLNKMTRPKL